MNIVLIVATFVPLAGALVMMALPKEEEGLHKMLALVASTASLILGIVLLFGFEYGFGSDRPGFIDGAEDIQFLTDEGWIGVINSRFIVGLDGMSLPLFILTVAVVPLCILYSFGHFPEPHNPKAFLILLLVLETGMLGSFVAQDLILFFVFFEVVLLPMFFMIGVWGGDARRYASL